MPKGKGTYGKKRGRPPKKGKATNKKMSKSVKKTKSKSIKKKY